MGLNTSSKINYDFSSLKKELKDIKNNLKLVNTEVQLVKEQNKGWENSAEKLNKVLTAQKNVINENEKKTAKLKEIYDGLKNTYDETNKKVIDAKEAWLKSQVATEKAKNEYKKYQEVGKGVVNTNNDICKSLSWFQLELVNLANTIAQKTLKGLVDFIKQAVNVGIEYESAFAGVRKTVDATDEEFQKLNEDIIKMSRVKPISQSDIASIYEMGGQLGIAKDNLSDFANVIADLDVATNLNLDEAGTMLAQYANITKMSSEEFSRFGSSLVALGNNSATSEKDIMEMAQRISGTASQIKMSNQDIVALSASLASVGINAEVGGTAISTIMSNIDKSVAKNSESLTAWADVAGLSVNEFKNLWNNDVSSAIQKVIKGLGDAKAGGTNLNLVLEDLGITNIRQTDTMKRLSNASDLLNKSLAIANTAWKENTALSNEANQRYQTTEAKMQLLKNSLQELQIALFENLKKPLGEAIDELKKFSQSEDVKIFINSFSKTLSSGMKLGVSLIKGLISNFDILIRTAKMATTTLASMFVASLIVKINSFIKGIQAGTTAIKIFNVALSSNPLMMVATALGVVGGLLWAFKDKLTGTTEKIKENTKSLKENYQQILDNNKARENEIKSIESEYGYYSQLINELKTLCDENGNVKQGYEDRVNTIIPLLKNATGEEITLIDNQIQDYNNLMTTLDKVIAKKRAEARLNAYKGDYENALKSIDEAKEKREELAEQYREELQKLWNIDQKVVVKYGYGRNYEIVNPKWQKQKKVVDEYREALDLIEQSRDKNNKTIKEYENLLKDYYEEYEKNIVKTTETTTNNLDNQVNNAVNTTATAINKQTTNAKNELQNVNAAIDDTNNKIDEFKNKVDSINDNDNEVSEEFQIDTPEFSQGVIFGKGVLGDKAVELAGMGKDAAEAYMNAFKDTYNKSQENMEEAIYNKANNQAMLESTAYQEATLLPENIQKYVLTENVIADTKQTAQSQGLLNNAYKVVNATIETTNQAKVAALSIDFRVVGDNIVSGIAAGIRENAYKAIEAARELARAINEAMEDEEEIASPSKVFKRYGRYISEGLAIGIEENKKLAVIQMNGLASNLQNSINSVKSFDSHNNSKNRQNNDINGGNNQVINNNYNFNQTNNSPTQLDRLQIFRQTKSLLKIATM